MTFIDPYAETLDDPNVPFEKRWQLLNDLDDLNHRFGVYKKVLAQWDAFASLEKEWPEAGLSILEVGSGSGGLSRELEKWAIKNKKRLNFHLYDSQGDVLQEAAKGFTQNQPTIHIAKENYLQAFKDLEI